MAKRLLLEVTLSYDPLVGRSVGLSVIHNIKFPLLCSYRGTCYCIELVHLKCRQDLYSPSGKVGWILQILCLRAKERQVGECQEGNRPGQRHQQEDPQAKVLPERPDDCADARLVAALVDVACGIFHVVVVCTDVVFYGWGVVASYGFRVFDW